MSLIVIGGTSGINAAQLLALIRQVDGEGSGLDADTVRGQTPLFAQEAAPGLPTGIPLFRTATAPTHTYLRSLFRN